MFSKGQLALNFLPAVAFNFFKVSTRRMISLDSYIEVAGSDYPVTPKYLGKSAQVHINDWWIKVFFREELIQHLSTVGKRCFYSDISSLIVNKD
jgi:hypothetical protein